MPCCPPPRTGVRDEVVGAMSERDDLEIGRWVRLADPSPPISAEIAKRVEAATRAHWRAEVARRRHRVQFQRLAALAASLLVVAVAVSAWKQLAPSSTAPVRVAIVIDEAWQRGPDGSRVRLVSGAEIAPESEISTGSGARIALALPSGHSIRIDHDSRLRVLSGSRLAIDRGAVYVASGAQGRITGPPLILSTPSVDVREVGTQYEVRLEPDTTRVRVREGSVRVETPRATHPVDAGTELGIAADGIVSRRSIESWGAEWAWVGATAPVFEIEGSTLRAFLDWAAREGGWNVVFEEASVAGRASSIILNGSIEGLPIEDALAAVLPTCQLTHRIENGRLSIRSADDQEFGGS